MQTLTEKQLLIPEWPAPSSVGAYVTTRYGGCSRAPYGIVEGRVEAATSLAQGLNLGDHVGDDPQAVKCNRELLAQYLPSEPIWLNQIHSATVLELDAQTKVDERIAADGVVTALPRTVCAVLTADCLPILFCDEAGTAVGAAHAGWRGLCAGIVENVALAHAKLAECHPLKQMAWFGPAIGAQQFEVGDDVREAFMNAALIHEKEMTAQAFNVGRCAGKWSCDLSLLATIRLARVGVKAIYLSQRCTVSDAQNFYSYRRDGVTGRMASLIWLK